MTKQCVIEGCTQFTTPKTAKGMCKSHYEKLRRNGDPLYRREYTLTNDPGYSTVHKWLVKFRGSANEYLCECGKAAEDWACIAKDATETMKGYIAGYSQDINNYKPMCKSCHIKSDKSPLKQLCIRGHNNWYYYENKNKRYCRTCARELRKINV